MLSIKPLLHVDNEGHLVPVEKIRSNKKVVDRMLQIFHDTILLPFDGESEQVIFISHADNQEAAEKLADIVREKPGVKEVRIGWISPVIGAHCGAGTLAILDVYKRQSAYGGDRNYWTAIIQSCGLAANIRAEDLHLDDMLRLYNQHISQ